MQGLSHLCALFRDEMGPQEEGSLGESAAFHLDGSKVPRSEHFLGLQITFISLGWGGGRETQHVVYFISLGIENGVREQRPMTLFDGEVGTTGSEDSWEPCPYPGLLECVCVSGGARQGAKRLVSACLSSAPSLVMAVRGQVSASAGSFCPHCSSLPPPPSRACAEQDLSSCVPCLLCPRLSSWRRCSYYLRKAGSPHVVLHS